MQITIRSKPFDPYEEMMRYHAGLECKGKFGATACFIGTMRDFNDGEPVRSMFLEHYPAMTEKHLHSIYEQAAMKWEMLDCLLLHRVGEIAINDVIVLIVVWSTHRGDALDACRFMIEDLKSRAPFWKKEQLADGERWVESNTSGYSS